MFSIREGKTKLDHKSLMIQRNYKEIKWQRENVKRNEKSEKAWHTRTPNMDDADLCIRLNIKFLLLARRLATGEVPASNPGKGENLLISGLKGNLIIWIWIPS